MNYLVNPKEYDYKFLKYKEDVSMKLIKSLLLLLTIVGHLATIEPIAAVAQAQDSGTNSVYLPIIMSLDSDVDASENMPSDAELAKIMARKYEAVPITGEWLEAHGNWLSGELERIQNTMHARRSGDSINGADIDSLIDYSNEPSSPELEAFSEEGEVQASRSEGNSNRVDIGKARRGDILLGHGQKFQWWGWWRHAAIMHNNSSYVEAPGGNAKNRTNPAYKWKSTWDAGAVMRVNTTNAKKSSASKYALNQRGEGYSVWSSKWSQNVWYCSKLAWAAYYHTSQDGWKWWTRIDLDPSGGNWVTPDDLWFSWRTKLISFSW